MLSDAAIRSLKTGPKPTKHADGGGLFILVNPDGKKRWRLFYRFAGKQKLLSGGPYPVVKLSDARKWRDEAKGHLLEGRDPSTIRKAEKKALGRQRDKTLLRLSPTNGCIPVRACGPNANRPE